MLTSQKGFTGPKLSAQDGFASLLTLLLILILIGAAVGGIFFFQKQPIKEELLRQLQLPTPIPSATPGPTQNYQNSTLGLTFDYPKSWQLKQTLVKSASSSAKTAHPVLELSPAGFTGTQTPIKLIYWDNPTNLAPSELDKKLVTQKDQEIVYSIEDTYMLSGSGLTANFRNAGVCETKICQIYTISRDTKIYQLESFLNVNVFNQKAIFDGIINSFKFADFSKDGEALSVSTQTLKATHSAIPK